MGQVRDRGDKLPILSSCALSNNDLVTCSFSSQSLSPSGYLWTLLPLALEVISVTCSAACCPFRAPPACALPFKLILF